MPIFVATYDLNDEVKRPPITKVIRETWNYAMLSESSYAIEAVSADEIYNTLSQLIDSNDDLFVIQLKKPYRGWGLPIVHDWLESKLTY